MDELVGQLIWAFVTGDDDIDRVEHAIRRGRVGGVWLLPPQMPSPGETARLVNRLQAAASTPLLVGVDAEAGLGLVMRGATLLPTAMAIGATGDASLAKAAGSVTAIEASACGINAVAAPVLDVNNNPANPIINTRSFGDNPEQVARMGVAFCEGLTSLEDGRHVLPIGKHFPGHGDTRVDSHLELDAVEQPLERLEAVELAPFAEAIRHDIPMIMTAHVAYPAIDPSGAPATLSKPIMTDLLRTRMGFRGAVVTDCMNMHAISHNFPAGEAAAEAVLAGCDLVMTDTWEEAYEGILHGILEDHIRGSRIREAANRVKQIKSLIFGPGLARPALIDPDSAGQDVDAATHSAIADRIAEASITVVDGSIPQPEGRPFVMATLMARRFGPSVEVQVRSILSELGRSDVDVMVLNPQPDSIQMAEAVQRASAAGWAALLHFNRVESFDPEAVLARDELAELVDAIAAAGTPVTVASMGSPYILPAFSSARATICAYSTSDASVRAALRALVGSEVSGGALAAHA